MFLKSMKIKYNQERKCTTAPPALYTNPKSVHYLQKRQNQIYSSDLKKHFLRHFSAAINFWKVYLA